MDSGWGSEKRDLETPENRNLSMMNKKEQKTEETKRKIIDAGLHLFARQGYHKTTVQDLAGYIGMTSGALFHHFSSKKEILYRVIDRLNTGMDRYIDYLSRNRQGRMEIDEPAKGFVDMITCGRTEEPLR